MNVFQYQLENFRGAPIYCKCPECGNSDTYQRYVKNGAGEPLSDDIGKCVCGYHKEPPTDERVPAFISHDIFSESLNRFTNNNLFNFLTSKYGLDKATQAASKYCIGTSNAFPGASVFWQIDEKNKVRTGRISLFNTKSGDEEFKGWVHERQKIKSNDIKKCMFGQHLLEKEPGKTVVIVEDEKTAIEASCLYPEYLWISANGFPPDALGRKVLGRRPFICKPKTWKNKLRSLNHIRSIV